MALARLAGRKLAERAGFGTVDTHCIVTSISELASNIVVHAGRGSLTLSLTQRGDGKTGMKVIARDEGPGIDDQHLALRDHFSTAGGLGCGLPGVKRLMSELEVLPAPGPGCVVRAVKWMEATAPTKLMAPSTFAFLESQQPQAVGNRREAADETFSDGNALEGRKPTCPRGARTEGQEMPDNQSQNPPVDTYASSDGTYRWELWEGDHRVLVIRPQGTATREGVEALYAALERISTQRGEKLRLLSVSTDMVTMKPDAKAASGKLLKSGSPLQRFATVGDTFFMRAFFNLFAVVASVEMAAFQTEQEATAWLAK